MQVTGIYSFQRDGLEAGIHLGVMQKVLIDGNEQILLAKTG